MKTLKIYLNEDGTIQNYSQDFVINQFSFQDTLLNIYVPYSIVDMNMTSDDDNVVYGTNIQMGMIYTRTNGTEQMGVGYLFTFVKDNVVLNNKRYVLFERIMPKEFTLYSGNQTYAINVVNTKTETTLDDDNNEVITTTVINIITSARYSIYISPSANFNEDTDDTTDLENVISQVNSLLSQMNLKQDKEDSNINVYTTKLHDTTTQIVVNALNSLNARETNSENDISTLTSDMTQAQQDIIDLQNTLIVGYRYLGQITSNNDPSSAALTSWATSEGYTLQNGDEITWVKTVPLGTDIIYVCKYVQTWNWYAMPSVEPASYMTLGLIKGNAQGNETTGTANTIVKIVDGVITNIYILSTDGVYHDIRDIVNVNSTKIEQMLDGTLSIDSAIYATYDSDEKSNVVKKTFAQKYATFGYVDNAIKDYALPKEFNDIKYLDFEDNIVVDEVSDLPATYYKTLDVSTIGTKTIFSCVETLNYDFTLSKSNTYRVKIVCGEDGTYNTSTQYTLNIYATDSENNSTLLASETIAQNIYTNNQLVFDGNFNQIAEEFYLDSTYTITIELLALIETTANTSLMFISNTQFPATYQLNIQMTSLVISEGLKAQTYNFDKIATALTVDNVDYYTITLDENDISYVNFLSGNFLSHFKITYSSASEIDYTRKLAVIYSASNGDTPPLVFTNDSTNSLCALYKLKPTLKKKELANGVYTYIFEFDAFYENLINMKFIIDLPKTTPIQMTATEYATITSLNPKEPIIIADDTTTYQLVDTATTQTISGAKTFTSTTTTRNILPETNNTYDLGSSSYYLKKLWTYNIGNSTSNITYWTNGMTFQSGGTDIWWTNATNLAPTTTDTVNLGTSTQKWKAVYSNRYYVGTHYIDNASATSMNFITNGMMLIMDQGGKAFRPSTTDRGVVSLGSSYHYWKDCYINGVLSDGTNSITVAQIVAGLSPKYIHRVFFGKTQSEGIQLNLTSSKSTTLTLAEVLAIVGEQCGMAGMAIIGDPDTAPYVFADQKLNYIYWNYGDEFFYICNASTNTTITDNSNDTWTVFRDDITQI